MGLAVSEQVCGMTETRPSCRKSTAALDVCRRAWIKLLNGLLERNAADLAAQCVVSLHRPVLDVELGMYLARQALIGKDVEFTVSFELASIQRQMAVLVMPIVKVEVTTQFVETCRTANRLAGSSVHGPY